MKADTKSEVEGEKSRKGGIHRIHLNVDCGHILLRASQFAIQKKQQK